MKKKLTLTWAVLRLVWESKGYSMKEMPDLLLARWPGRKGLAFTSLQRKAQKGARAPGDVARFIMDAEQLPLRGGYEEPAEVVRLGLLALRGRLPNRDPRKLAADLLKHFPMDEFAIRLADALTKQTGPSSGTGSLFDVFVRAIVDRLSRMPQLRLVKLARRTTRLLAAIRLLRASVEHTDAKVDVVDAKLDGQAQRLRRMELKLTGIGVAVCVGILLQCHQPNVNVTIGWGGDTAHARGGGAAEDAPGLVYWALPPFLGPFVAGRTGEKTPPELFVPDHPLPHQKLAPCDAQVAESPLSGACWVETTKPPPCRPLYRSGNKCYRPVSEDPTKPIGGERQPEPRQENRYMPGREP